VITAKEFNAAIALLGWNGLEASNQLGVHKVTISNWRNGKKKIPIYIEKLVSLYLKDKDNFRNNRKPVESMKYMLGG